MSKWQPVDDGDSGSPYRLCERVPVDAVAWGYDGPATIQVYGGGYIAVRFNATEFPQGPPESGHWEIQITLKNKSEVNDE